jgi:hypothetical protein
MLTDRPYGAKRTPAQVMRNLEALEALRQRKLARGELFQIVMGVAPANVVRSRSQSAPQDPASDDGGDGWADGRPVPIFRPRSLTTSIDNMKCLDCGGLIYGDNGEPLKSQPRRCRPCGTAKRRAHNKAQRGDTIPADGEGTPANSETPTRQAHSDSESKSKSVPSSPSTPTINTKAWYE